MGCGRVPSLCMYVKGNKLRPFLSSSYAGRSWRRTLSHRTVVGQLRFRGSTWLVAVLGLIFCLGGIMDNALDTTPGLAITELDGEHRYPAVDAGRRSSAATGERGRSTLDHLHRARCRNRRLNACPERACKVTNSDPKCQCCIMSLQKRHCLTRQQLSSKMTAISQRHD